MSGFLGLGFIGLKGHWKWTNLQDEVQFGIVPAQVAVGERLCLGHLRIDALEFFLHFGSPSDGRLRETFAFGLGYFECRLLD